MLFALPGSRAGPWRGSAFCRNKAEGTKERAGGPATATVYLWRERNLRGGLVSEPIPVLIQTLGRFLAFFTSQALLPESVCLQAAWGSEASDPYGNEQGEEE